MSRLVLDEPIAGNKYRLVLDEPVKFNLVPDEPSDKPKPSLFKKTVREYSAQLADLLKVPSALTGLPHLPMESELATKTLPSMARRTVERAVTPIKTFDVPSISTRNIKEIGKLLTGQKPKFETSEVSPSPLDIALLSLIAKGGIQDVAGRVSRNIYLNKAIQSEKLRGVIMENMPHLKKALAQGGIKLPANLPLEDKVSVVLSQAEKSPTFGNLITKLEKGQLRPVAPIPQKPFTDIQPQPKPTATVTPAVTPKAPAAAAPVIPSTKPI